MLVIPFAVFALLCSVTAAPRERSYDVFSDSYPTFNPMPFPYARPFGTFSAFGMGLPWFQPVPMYIPMPDVSQFMPWYKGNNVCETKKVMEEPDQIKEWMDDGFDGTFDFTHESENCRGNNNKYMCIKRILTNEGAKLEMTKYECCYGFVRATRGPGCVESSKEQVADTSSSNVQATQLQEKNRYEYKFIPSKSDKSGVENVPLQ